MWICGLESTILFWLATKELEEKWEGGYGGHFRPSCLPSNLLSFNFSSLKPGETGVKSDANGKWPVLRLAVGSNKEQPCPGCLGEQQLPCPWVLLAPSRWSRVWICWELDGQSSGIGMLMPCTFPWRPGDGTALQWCLGKAGLELRE